MDRLLLHDLLALSPSPFFRSGSRSESHGFLHLSSTKSYPLFSFRAAVSDAIQSSIPEQGKRRLQAKGRRESLHELPYRNEINFTKDEEKLLESLAKTKHPLPRRVFKSAGSRSIPSRSTIPGLRSKYSKPDPKLQKTGYLVRNPNSVRKLLHSSGSGSDTQETDEETIDWFDSDSEADDKETCFPDLAKAHSKSSKKTVGSFSSRKLETRSSGIGGNATMSQEEMDASIDQSDRRTEISATDQMVPSGRNATMSQEKMDGSIDQSDRHTEIYATDQMVPSGVVGEDRLIGSKDSIHTDAKYFVEPVPTDYSHGIQRTISSTTDVAQVSDWKRHPLCDLDFDIQYSYSETPDAPILGFRDIYSPFGPATIQRPWTGLPPERPRRHLENCLNPVERKFMLEGYPDSSPRKSTKSREDILGKPLTHEEITHLVNKCHAEGRQVNLGRDGLTHNMLHLIHTHWKKRPVCKIKCRGVPTIDMENLCFHIEDKTGGKIICKSGGVLYVFRGRNYSYRNHPRIPLMLWKPASPIYPKVVPKVPDGLTAEKAYNLRVLGQKIEPLCKLGKNAVYLTLVADVRQAFTVDDLVVLDYEGLNSSDYKKIAAKLRDLVPCTILSFRNQRILLWKGRAVDSSLDERVQMDYQHSPKVVDSDSSIVGRPAIQLENMNVLHQSRLCSTSDGPPTFQSENVSCDSSHVSSGGDASGILLDKPKLRQPYLNGTPAVSDILVSSEKEDYEDSDIDDEEQDGMLTKEDRINDYCHEISIHDDIDISWELALRSGMALKLEDSNLDADRILHRSDIFSRIASAGPDYSEKLINRLRIKVDDHETLGDKEVHFYTKCRKPSRQFKATFQATPYRKIEADDLLGLIIPTR